MNTTPKVRSTEIVNTSLVVVAEVYDKQEGNLIILISLSGIKVSKIKPTVALNKSELDVMICFFVIKNIKIIDKKHANCCLYQNNAYICTYYNKKY